MFKNNSHQRGHGDVLDEQFPITQLFGHHQQHTDWALPQKWGGFPAASKIGGFFNSQHPNK